MVYCVQLYGPLHRMEGDLLTGLKALAEAGLTQLEPCVSLEPRPGEEKIFWPVDWLTEHAEEIRGCGAEIVSAHLFGRNPAGQLHRLKAAARATGLKAYVLQAPEKLDEISLQQAALELTALADGLEEIGVEVWLHNLAGEIQTKMAGTTAYERLLDLCRGKVFAQPDVGWVQFAGEDPVDFLRRNAGRVRAVHYKDFPAPGQQPDVSIGTGGLDCRAVARFAQERGLPQYLDQETFAGDVPGELAEVARRLGRFANDRENTVSYLNTYDVKTGEVQVLARFEKIIEAPNWMQTQNALVYNAEGRLWRFDLDTGENALLDTGTCTQCNNDHVLSPDETEAAVSHMTFENGYTSRVYRVPLNGGEPRLITEGSPSYLHGWSPDGKEMVYCAFRGEPPAVDVYAISADGGRERRLTDGVGYNDGPEYSPDGKQIWYNSTRSGLMQAWRMDRDGSRPVQMTHNARNNWFPHVSPDGRRVVYISYGEKQLSPHEHLPNMPVELWLMNADGSDPHRILSLFGGQGTINVNSWAPDSRRFAFVSYEVTD